MNRAIAARRERIAALNQTTQEIDSLARVTCREEMPEFPGFDQEDNEELSAWDSFDSHAYANEATAYRRGMTCELVEALED